MEIFIAAIAGALGNLSSDAVKAAYKGMKDIVLRKFGAESDLADALKKLEKQPGAQWRQAALLDEAESVGADKDEEIMQAAQALLDAVKAQPGSANISQTASGDHSKVISVVGGQHVSINA